MNLTLHYNVTDEELLAHGFTKGHKYWNGYDIAINRITREICVKYYSSGYRGERNIPLPSILLELFEKGWICLG